MGLFGALFAGVSGLDSQSNKIGIISNNISNVNTVGYKQGSADFDTLVVPSGTTAFSPGGVIGGNLQLVDQQGTIAASTSSTDVAISGGGFLVVDSNSTGTGNTYYTRAGSFTQDAQGNFVNSNKYYLMGLPIGTNGQPAQANTQNLKVVTVSQSATGAATASTALSIAANLNATQTVLPGSSATATMQAANNTSAANVGATGSQIIVGADFGAAPANNLLRNDTLTITSGAPANKTDTFSYGGFSVGRNVADGTSAGDGDGMNTLLVTPETLAANSAISNNGSNNVITVTVANSADYAEGFAYITGSSSINGIPASQINGEQAVTIVDGTHISFTTTTAGAGGTAHTSTTAGTSTNRTFDFTGNILNATSPTDDFLASGISPKSSADFASDSLHFSISVAGSTPVTFQYSATPDPANATFNNLSTLAQAISDSPGLTAAVANGRLYVSATNANNSVTFTNGDAAGSGGLPGVNWVQELDLKNITTASSGTNFFNSLSGLAAQITSVDPTNLTATVKNPNAASALTITEANPEQTITFSDGAPGTGSILRELGFANLTTDPSVGAGAYTTGTLAITYSPSSAASDMSSGKVTPQFSHDVTVYDSQGNSHTLAMNFVKLATNFWGVEVTAVPASDVSSITGDGQIAYGTLTFSGNGALQSETGSIESAIPINWTNGAAPSTISLDFGLNAVTAKDGSGVTQTAGAFNVSQANQNGSPTGELTGVSIDSNGFVIANFSNGQTHKLFQVPLAAVNNPDGLEAVSGNAYQQTLASGIPNLQFAGTSGVGTFTPSALEQSNVDLSTQLTNLIVAQQAYGANSKLLTVADQLLQQLDQIIQ